MKFLLNSLIDFLEIEVAKWTDEEIKNVKFYIDEVADPLLEGVILRHDPSQAKTREFVDGTVLQFYSIGFYSRFSEKKNSRIILDTIAQTLDGLQLETETALLIMEVTTQTNFAYTDDKDRSIYNFSLAIESRKK